MPRAIQLIVPKAGPVKMAEQEGAEAARRGRARSSNPYSLSRGVVERQHWFVGYDRQLADLAEFP